MRDETRHVLNVSSPAKRKFCLTKPLLREREENLYFCPNIGEARAEHTELRSAQRRKNVCEEGEEGQCKGKTHKTSQNLVYQDHDRALQDSTDEGQQRKLHSQDGEV